MHSISSAFLSLPFYSVLVEGFYFQVLHHGRIYTGNSTRCIGHMQGEGQGVCPLQSIACFSGLWPITLSLPSALSQDEQEDVQLRIEDILQMVRELRSSLSEGTLYTTDNLMHIQIHLYETKPYPFVFFLYSLFSCHKTSRLSMSTGRLRYTLEIEHYSTLATTPSFANV